MTITHINGVDSVLEDREYFGFNAILGSDSVEIKENSHTRNIGLVLNLFFSRFYRIWEVLARFLGSFWLTIRYFFDLASFPWKIDTGATIDPFGLEKRPNLKLGFGFH